MMASALRLRHEGLVLLHLCDCGRESTATSILFTRGSTASSTVIMKSFRDETL